MQTAWVGRGGIFRQLWHRCDVVSWLSNSPFPLLLQTGEGPKARLVSKACSLPLLLTGLPDWPRSNHTPSKCISNLGHFHLQVNLQVNWKCTVNCTLKWSKLETHWYIYQISQMSSTVLGCCAGTFWSRDCLGLWLTVASQHLHRVNMSPITSLRNDQNSKYGF